MNVASRSLGKLDLLTVSRAGDRQEETDLRTARVTSRVLRGESVVGP
jgi:hypothetical protein